MPRGYIANCSISRPIKKNVPVEREMGGFGWNTQIGLFIPMDQEELPLEDPYTGVEEAEDSE